MPRRYTPEEKAEANRIRKEKAKEWYRQRREMLLEKQKAYEKEKRQKANEEKGVERKPYGYLKAMTEEERKEHRRAQYKRYHETQRAKKGLPPPRPPSKTEEERAERKRERDQRYRTKRKLERETGVKWAFEPRMKVQEVTIPMA